MLVADLKFKVNFIRGVKDVALTTEELDATFGKQYRDVALTAETITQTAQRSGKDYALTGETVVQSTSKPRTDATDLGVDVMGDLKYEYLAYDENHDPYYERVFDPVTYENLSYGPVGQSWGVSIHNENGTSGTTDGTNGETP